MGKTPRGADGGRAGLRGDMAVYSVHEAPARPGHPASDPDRVEFVRDGFSFWAFLFAPLWMAWHRMWLVLAGYLVLAAALQAFFLYAGASRAAMTAAAALLALLVGLEAPTLRRFTLRRRGFREIGLAGGHDREIAERRFFAAWPPTRATSAVEPVAPAPPVRAAQPLAVVGLFPEPGAGR